MAALVRQLGNSALTRIHCGRDRLSLRLIHGQHRLPVARVGLQNLQHASLLGWVVQFHRLKLPATQACVTAGAQTRKVTPVPDSSA